MKTRFLIGCTLMSILTPVYADTIQVFQTESAVEHSYKQNPWIATICVAVASLIGQFIIAWVQYRGTINSKNRQDWIIEVRNSISEFLSQTEIINAMLIVVPKDDYKKQYELIPHVEKLTYHQNKLALLFPNSIDPDDNKLLDLLQEVKIMLNPSSTTYDFDKIIAMEDEIVDLSRIIIKREWDKISEKNSVLGFKRKLPLG